MGFSDGSDHMQTICTLLQTDNHTDISLLNFYRPDALCGAQQCQKTQGIYLHIFCSSASSSCQSHSRLYGSANIHFHSFGMILPLL